MLVCPKEEPRWSEHTHSAVTGGLLKNAMAHSTELDGDQQHRQCGDNMSDIRSKDEVQSGKKKLLKCDISNLWLMIKHKIKLYYTWLL